MNKLNPLEKILIRLKPRFVEFKTSCVGFPITAIDKSSFLYMYNEIFVKKIYEFKNKNNIPIIIDCGANIGLSVIYFKQKYPESNIIAFEPDQKIFKILTENISSGNLKNILLLDQALSASSGEAYFQANGSDGGRITTEDTQNIKIKTTRLSDYLTNKVDFLKIDIEGSETEVLEECSGLLKNVDNLFVEYHSFKNKEQSLDRILKILQESGFRYYIDGFNSAQNQPFLDVGVYENMDLQLNIYAYRE